MLDFEDPRKAALMMMAAGLLSPVRSKGASGFGEALSQGLRGGLLGFNEASQNKRRNDVMAQQAAMQKLQMEAMQRQQADQEFAAAQAPKFFSPGNAPADGMGPVSPPKADIAGYGAALMGRNPAMGLPWLQAAQKDETPITVAEGATLVDRTTKQPIFSNAKKEKPKFAPGDTRTYKAGRVEITEEWDGQKWNKLGSSAIDKPDGPDKPMAPPAGYQWGADGKSLQAIPGGPADTKAGKEAEAAAARDKAAIGNAEFVLSQVGKAKAQAKNGWFTTGLPGKIMRNVGGTDALDLNSTVDSIKANIGFDTLAEMRRNSPTGGALGQVAVQELNMLQAARGALDTAQSEAQFIRALDGIEKHYKGWISAVQAASKGQQSDGATAPKPGTVDGDYVFIGGDPADSKNWKKRK